MARTVDTPLNEIRARLDPGSNRRWAIDRLDELFRSGRAPDPVPDGFLPGELITMSVSTPSDALVRRIASLYMPWMGKSFDAAASTGTNILKTSARGPMKVLWPSHKGARERNGGLVLEAFDFRTRIEAGAIDPDVQVLKIDYDSDDNPEFIIRHILDELVQIDEDLFLGKILYRYKSKWHPIGFFSLERQIEL